MKEPKKKSELSEAIKTLKKIISENHYDIDKRKLEPLDIIYVTKKLDHYSSSPPIQEFIKNNKNFIYYLASHSLEAAEIILSKRGLGQHLTASETATIINKTTTAFMQRLIKESLKKSPVSVSALDQINDFIKGTNFTITTLLKDNKAFDILYHNPHMRSFIQHIDPVEQFALLAAGKYDHELHPGRRAKPVEIANIIKDHYKDDASIKKFLNSNPHFLFNLAKEDFEAAKILLSSKVLAKSFSAKEIGQIIYKFSDQLYNQARKQDANVAHHYYQEADKFINQTGHSLKTLIKIPEVANLFKSNKNLSAAVHAMQQDITAKEKHIYKTQTHS